MLGPDLARQIFGVDHATVVTALADEAQLTMTSADGLLSSAVWTTCAYLAEQFGDNLDRQTLLGVLVAEEQGLIEAGWSDTFTRLGLREPAASVAVAPVERPHAGVFDPASVAVTGSQVITPSVGRDIPTEPTQPIMIDNNNGRGPSSPYPSSPQAPPSLPGQSVPGGQQPFPPQASDGRYPPPVRGPQRSGQADPYRPSYSDQVPPAPARPGAYPPPERGFDEGGGQRAIPPLRQGGEYPPPSDRYQVRDPRYDDRFDEQASSPRRPQPRPRPSAEFERSPQRRWLPVVVSAIGVVFLGAIAYFLLGDSLSGGDSTDVESASSAESGDPSSATSTSLRAADAEPIQAGASLPTDILELGVPMVDIFEGTDKSGFADLTLDPIKGEICYNVTTDGVAGPYDAHIHSGEINVKGGVVVDFGDFVNPESGCWVGRPIDIQAVMANLDKFYVEMHDSDDIVTVRGQLSAGLRPEDAARLDEDDQSQVALFDPDSGGATAVIESGRLVLNGEVADEATVNLLLSQFDDLAAAGSEVVNNLTINPAAPLPTGKIAVDDAIFFAIGSADLNPGDNQILNDLATVFKSRPEWTALVVGHTDSTGTDVYNLELSQQRANAVFQALVGLGVPAEQMRTEGAGSTNPIASNDTEEGRSQNRRIEFEVDTGQ